MNENQKADAVAHGTPSTEGNPAGRPLSVADRLERIRDAAIGAAQFARSLVHHANTTTRWLKAEASWKSNVERTGAWAMIEEQYWWLLGEAREQLEAWPLVPPLRRLLNYQKRGPFRLWGTTSPNAHMAALRLADEVDICARISAFEIPQNADSRASGDCPIGYEHFKDSPHYGPAIEFTNALLGLGAFSERAMEKLNAEVWIEADGAAIDAAQFSDDRVAAGPPDACRLVLSVHDDTATLDGERFAITQDQAEILEKLIDRGGANVSGRALRSSPGSRPDEIIKRLPGRIRRVVTTRKGHGGGYAITVKARVEHSQSTHRTRVDAG
jgi:hypothetical protein